MKTKPSFRTAILLFAGAFIIVVVAPLSAATVILEPIADTAIMESYPDNNQGGHTHAATGLNGSRAVSIGARRTLLRFDVSSAVPAGAQIESVSLTVNVSRTPDSVSRNHTLHRLLVGWMEGTGVGNEAGEPAETGETTWNNRMHPDVPWSSPGAEGDFAPAPSATEAFLGQPGNFTLSGGSLATDVTAWLENPSSNHGWLLMSADAESVSSGFTARRIDTREALASDDRPKLTIEFTPPPPMLANPVLQSNGDFEFTVNSTAGELHRIEASTDLINWTEVGSMTPAGDSFSFTDFAVGDQPMSFYRVLRGPGL